MSTISSMANKITEAALKCDTVDVLQPILIGEGAWKNELLFFTKPEVFLVSKIDQSIKIVDLILKKFEDFDVMIDGVCVIGGQVLDEKEIMNRHYGFINVLSRSASKILKADDISKIENKLGISIKGFDILGGHEYLKEYPKETPSELDRFWWTGDSSKIRSGFYVRAVKKDGRDMILVNAFHPEQLAHYTDPSHKIVLMLLHSNTNWSTLKNEMVGNSYPNDAVPDSIRGILYTHAQDYGFETVTIANNCTHLSAGPFEAMFEIMNFLGKIINLDIQKQPPLTLKRMLEADINYEDALRALDNPQIRYTDKATDLFTATEDMNTDEAVALFKKSLT